MTLLYPSGLQFTGPASPSSTSLRNNKLKGRPRGSEVAWPATTGLIWVMLRSLTVTHTSLKMYPHLSELHAHLTLMDEEFWCCGLKELRFFMLVFFASIEQHILLYRGRQKTHAEMWHVAKALGLNSIKDISSMRYAPGTFSKLMKESC